MVKLDKNGSTVQRLNAESVAILKQYGTMVDTDNPESWGVDEAISRMHAVAGGFAQAVTARTQPEDESVKTSGLTRQELEQALRKSNEELLKRMAAVVQSACDSAIAPYVSQ